MYSSNLVTLPYRSPNPAPGPHAPGTLESLFATQPLETFAAGQAVFWEGDPSTHAFQIAEGCLRAYRILPDGRRAVTAFIFAGEVLGVSFQGPYLYTAQAVTPVRLRRISLSRLHEARESPALGRLLLTRIYEEIRSAHNLITLLGQLSAEERVANFLVSTARRTAQDEGPVVIELPMSRRDIADYLGLTIETVCRALSKFKRRGLIALEGRNRVVLRRMESLQALTGEEEAHAPNFQRRQTPSVAQLN
jgi:CRP/FNR family transcriptional regulator